MMGTAQAQKSIFAAVQIEDLVPADHPLRKIRPLINADRIRELCKPFYSDDGRPSIPPEQLFLAMLGGYLLGCQSDRMIIRQLTCDMAFRRFVGLDLDSEIWHATTFSKNREHRFDETTVLEQLFDDTIKEAMKQGWVSLHRSVDGTLVRANASQKSFVPIELMQQPADYRKTMSSQKKEEGRKGDGDKDNPNVNWQGEKRSNETHRSTTDPDARLATKSSKETAVPGYTVNGVMENRNRFLMGIGVEIFTGHAERNGAEDILDRAKDRLGIEPESLGGDKGYFVRAFAQGLLDRNIEPHLSIKKKGRGGALMRVRMRKRGEGFQWSQRARKKIEELWGEGKALHGLRRFLRRMLANVRQEALLIGWLLEGFPVVRTTVDLI
jgi:transposase